MLPNTIENDTEVAISEGLKANDLVIYEGNLNLDHDAVVEVQSQDSTAVKF